MKAQVRLLITYIYIHLINHLWLKTGAYFLPEFLSLQSGYINYANKYSIITCKMEEVK
jgi:hypothetical protein